MNKYLLNILESSSLLIMAGYVKPCDNDKDINQFALQIRARDTLEMCLGLASLKAELIAESLFKPV